MGGWLVESAGRPRTGIIVSCLLAGCAMLLLPTMIWPRGIQPLGLSLLLGVAIGPGAGAIVALPSRAVAPTNRAVGFGVFYTA
jgi:hypothetical protein